MDQFGEKRTEQNANVAPLLERAFIFLEDGDWSSADKYCERVLDIDPKCADAYLVKLMAEMQASKREKLKECAEPFDGSGNYQKVLRFADECIKAELTGYIEHIKTRNENARLESIYTRGRNTMFAATAEKAFKEAERIFKTIPEYKDATQLAQECHKLAEDAKKEAVLADAKDKMAGNTVYNYEEAIRLLQHIPGWKDADERIVACNDGIKKIKAEQECLRQEAERKVKRKKTISIITATVICAIIAFIIVLNTVIIPNSKYNDAIALMNAGKYEEAIAAFKTMDGYKDSIAKIDDCKYKNACALKVAGQYKEAIAAFWALDGYKDSKEQVRALWDHVAQRDTISAGYDHTVGLKIDGTVVARGGNSYGQCDVDDWTDIVAIGAGGSYTVGLKADGTVVAVGNNGQGQCEVSDWTNIVAISAGGAHPVGLKADGTVVAVGRNSEGQCDVSGWTNIVAICAGGVHTVGLKADGTVVAVGRNSEGQCDVSEWTDIVAISAGNYHTVGLKADGTVVATHYLGDYFNYGQCGVNHLRNIVAISAGDEHTVGLKADGTVEATFYLDYESFSGQCDVDDWTDIVAISAGSNHTVGLKADGTVVATPYYGRYVYSGQCNVSSWRNIKVN